MKNMQKKKERKKISWLLWLQYMGKWIREYVHIP